MSKKPPTVEEQAHMSRVARAGCVVTRLAYGAYADADVHHITRGGRRLGHMYVLPLSPWYHRAVPSGEMTPALMRESYGPSFAEDKAAFEARFGTEEYLLEETLRWLGLTDKTALRRFSALSLPSLTTSASDQTDAK